MGTSQTTAALAAEVLPFSLSQNEVWLDQLSWPGSSHLNIGGYGFIIGPFDLGRFRAALTQLVAESEALRLVPLPEGGQRLLEEYDPPLAMVDCSASPQPRAAMREWWKQQMALPFPLDGTPPWRFTLLRGGENLHGLTIQFHHLVMDGWGTVQVMRRWSEIFNALETGELPPAVVGRSYREAIDESLAYRQSSTFADDAAYWRDQLPALPPPLIEHRFGTLHRDKLPAAHVSVHPIHRSDYDRVNLFAAERGLTTFTLLLSVLMIYFARLRNRQDIVIGVPNLNRGGKRYKNTLGMFVGVFPLRIQLTPEMPLSTLLTEVATVLRGNLRHSRYPLSEIGRSLQLIRQGRDTLFDVVLSFERQDYAINFGQGVAQESRQLFSGAARYPLGVTICEFHPEQDIELILEASAACFAPEQADMIGRRLWWLIEDMMARPERTLGEMEILPPEERWALLQGVHQDAANLQSPQPFIVHFEHQAALRPQAIALLWESGQMDYATLDQRASQLATQLVRAGAGKDVIIAFALERSPEMVLAVLAIAKAGAAFLPLDADAPLERLSGILEESQALALLIQTENIARLGGLHRETIIVSAAAGADETSQQASLPAPQAGDLAYVLFTSGSSGRPKGVMIEHAALAMRLSWLSRTYGVDSADRSALATQITFDPALIELCLPLIHGASIALPPPGRLSPETLAAFAEQHAVTIMAFVPSTLRRFSAGAAQCQHLKLRVACCGGEVLPADVARQFIHCTGARLFNVYGPTESAIFATAWPCSGDGDETTLPVGRPIDDTRIYVLDLQLRPLPFYEIGEVYIGGVVARGYLNRPDLDRAAFFADPFCPGGRMYRSGDQGWLSADGCLNFVGRLDRQIKLRGYRIELGEIEAALRAIAGVVQAAVKLVGQDEKPSLHAWVAMPGGGNAAALQDELRRRLPDYMLPSAIMVLPALPESEVGKIAYSRLPAAQSAEQALPSRLPGSQLEQDLLAIWEKALGRQALGVGDNFFDSGGDSLAAVEILAGVAKRTGRKIPLYLLTENPSVAALAAVLGGESASGSVMLGLGEGRGSVPLYLAASGYGDFSRFSSLARALGSPFEITMLQPPGTREFRTPQELAAIYTERIVGQAATAGYVAGYVAGFSVAGIVALETYRQLKQRGVAVRGLILLDSVYPGTFFRTARLWRCCDWLVRVFRLHDLSLNGRRLGSLFSDPALVAQVQAIADYRPAPLAEPVALIKSAGLLFWDRWAFSGWRRLFGKNLQEYVIPGMHGSIFEENNVGQLAAVLRTALQSANHPRAGDAGK